MARGRNALAAATVMAGIAIVLGLGVSAGGGQDGPWPDSHVTAHYIGNERRGAETRPLSPRGKFYLLASTSAARISGGAASSSSALAINAAAISPLMCASRASSVPKVSKIQNVVGEVRAAYQSTVPCSACASGSAPVNSSATSSAFSGFASIRATNAYGVSIIGSSSVRPLAGI